MIESRVIEHAWRQWEPQIVYVHHQSSPFPTRIWLPPFSEPIGTDAPYLMSREVNMIGMAIAKGLEERGQVGATHMGTAFDAWYPGYIDYAPNFKNIAGVLDRDGALSVRDAARIHDRRLSRRTCATCGRRASTRARGRRAGGGCATRSTTWRRRRSSVLEYARSTRTRCCSIATRPGATRSRAARRKPPYRVRRPAGAARSGRRRRAAAAARVRRRARLAADGARRRSTATTYPGGHVGRADRSGIRRDGARSARRPEVSRTCASIPGGPPERPVRRGRLDAAAADGRARRRRRRRRCRDDVRASMKTARRRAVDPKLKPTRVRRGDARDAAPFDSVPGIGFDSNPGGGGHRAAGRAR